MTATRSWNCPSYRGPKCSRGHWHIAPHLDLLNRLLVRLAKGEIRRLMVFMPPRHGKSQLCSRYFPAWYLGLWPDHRVIVAGYGTEFASEWGRESRNLLQALGAELFDVDVRNDSSAAHRWGIAGHHGQLIAAGIGAGITGRGADLLVIDDPIKTQQEADSEAERDKVWKWWESEAYTRLEPDSSCLLVMTRWHEDDLAGRLLKRQEEEREAGELDPEEEWTVVRFPALAESDECWCDDGSVLTPAEADQLEAGQLDDDVDASSGGDGRHPARHHRRRRKVVHRRAEGDALWPQRYGQRHFRRIERRNPRVFGSLYQQHPTPDAGEMFDPLDWRYVEGVPWDAVYLREWDMASTEKKQGNDPDWTVGTLLARTPDHRTFVVDQVRFRKAPGATEDLVEQTAMRDGHDVPVRMEQEPGSSGKTVIAHYRDEVLPDFDFDGEPSSGDKELRARPWAGQQSAGNVYLVAPRDEWGVDGKWRSFIEEHRQFPRGTHDDQVDSAAAGYNALAGASRQARGGRYKDRRARR